MPDTREMRARDMVKLSRHMLPRFYGEVVLHEGKEIGAVSVIFIEEMKYRPLLCLDITPELRKFPKFLVQIGRRFIKDAVAEYGEILTAEEADGEPTAKRFLEFLGFADTGETLNGRRVLKWQWS